jgi:hypothetical protein
MPYKSRFFPETRFGGFTYVDGTVNFFTRVNALLEPGSVVLDVGCGRGGYVADPVNYLSFSKLAYRLGIAHPRYAIPRAKNSIFAFARKQP